MSATQAPSAAALSRAPSGRLVPVDFDPFAGESVELDLWPREQTKLREETEKINIAGDYLLATMKGVVALGQGVYGFADVMSGGGIDRATEFALDEPLSVRFGRTMGILTAAQSPAMQAKLEKLHKAEGFWDSAWTVLSDPALLAEILVESGAFMGGGIAVSRAAFQSTAARVLTQTSHLGAAQARKLATQQGMKAAVLANIGYNGVIEGSMSGIDIKAEILTAPEKDLGPLYEELKAQLGPEEARRTLAESAQAMTTVVGGIIAGGASLVTGAGAFEARLFTGQAFKSGTGKLFREMFLGMAREAPEEMIQEGGGAFAQNLGKRTYVDPNQSLMEGVPEGAGMGLAFGLAAGAGFGGASALGGGRRGDDEDAPVVPPAGGGEPVRVADVPGMGAPDDGNLLKPSSKDERYPLRDLQGRKYRDHPPGGVVDADEVTHPVTGQIYPPGTDFNAAVAPAQANLAEPETPAFAFTSGRSGRAATERGTEIEFEYAVVDANDLKASHLTDLRTNPDYPAQLQPRDRDRAASEAQITRIANNIKPELLGESPLVSMGAPVIGKDGAVESGNARVIALQRAYAGKSRGETYRQWLYVSAERFGLPPGAADTVRNPVLVRLRKTPVDRVEFARQANENAVASMSATEVAKNDAARIDSLDGLEIDEAGNIDAQASGPFLRRFMTRAVGQAEQGQMVTAEGRLSQAGLSRVRNAIFAKAYGDADLVQMTAEATDANVRNVLGGLMRAAPRIAQMRDSMAAGALHDLDIVADLALAVREFSAMRARGDKLEAVLAQGELLGTRFSDDTVRLLRAIDEVSRSARRLSEFLGYYADAVEAAGNPQQSSLIDDGAPPSRGALIDQAAARSRKENDPDGTGTLFTGSGAGAAQEAAAGGAQETGGADPQALSGTAEAGEQDAAQPGGPGRADPGASENEQGGVKQERRRDTETRKRVAELSDEELRAQLLTNELTGLPNRRAYEESDKLPVQVSIDIDSLKWVNDNMGHASGDELLKAFAEVAKGLPGTVYHISGDEFVAQYETEQEAVDAMRKGQGLLRQSVVEVTRPDGSTVRKQGIGFSYGIGGTLSDAETGLQADKAAREQVGERAGRGETPSGVVEVPPQGQQDREGGDTEDEVGGDEGGETLPLLTPEQAEDTFEPFHHLFDAPGNSEVTRMGDKAKVYHKDHGWMTPAQARAKIEEWKEHAAAQGEDRDNNNGDKVVLSLFDMTGQWSQPWEDAGYQVYRFDIQNSPDQDIMQFSVEYFNDNFGAFEGADVHAILAACPCTDFAVSGARHFAAKDADGRTKQSIHLVEQTLATIEFFKPAVWAIENPVSRIGELTKLPPWRLSFDPNHFGDPYTKKTILWGRFNSDLPVAPVEATEGSKMHSQYGGKSQRTKNARSATPEGFAYAFFMANNAVDHPAMAIANKYDRLDRGLIERAVKAGVTEEQIKEAVDDFYYFDLDDKAANKAIAALIDGDTSDAGPDAPSAKPGATDFKPGDTVAIIGDKDGKVHTVESIGPDGWVYLRSGAATTPDKLEHATPKVVEHGGFGPMGIVDDAKPRTIDPELVRAFADRNRETPKGLYSSLHGFASAIERGDELVKLDWRGEPSKTEGVQLWFDLIRARRAGPELTSAAEKDADLRRMLPELDIAIEQWREALKTYTPTKHTTPVDDAAHGAATSPQNELAMPTDGQIKAGNYPKGHVVVSGINISIENPQFSYRTNITKADMAAKSEDESLPKEQRWAYADALNMLNSNDPVSALGALIVGKVNAGYWAVRMKAHYGYALGTVGFDKDHVDIFIKPGTPLDYDGPVYIIDQNKGNGHFDEHKIMFGWDSADAARAGYLEHYQPGWDRIRAITTTTVAELKDWLANQGLTVRPASESFALMRKAGTTFADLAKAGKAKSKGDAARREVEREAFRAALVMGDVTKAGELPFKEFSPRAADAVRFWIATQTESASAANDQARVDALKSIALDEGFMQSLYKEIRAAQKADDKSAGRDAEAYKAALAEAAEGDGIKTDDAEMFAAYQGGWDHALAGKTKSSLTGDLVGVRASGYDAAITWAETGAGQAWASGKGRRKLQNTDDALRRWFDKAKKEIDDAEGTASEFVAALEKTTMRADVFNVQMGENPSPGALLYINMLRDAVIPWKEWLFKGNHKPLERLYRYRGQGLAENIADWIVEPQVQEQMDARRAALKSVALEYIDMVSTFARAMDGGSRVEELAAKFSQFAWVNQGPPAEPGGFNKIDASKPGGVILPKIVRSTFVLARLTAGHGEAKVLAKDQDTTSAQTRKTPLTRPKLDGIIREESTDHRKGRDITPTAFKNTFGFGSVGFGKWVGAKQDQDHLNYAFDAFMDLAQLLGIEPKAIGLGGNLHFTIGALGHGRHAAHYADNQPHPDGGSVRVINVTNTKGDGTVAHEWMHALDYHLSRTEYGKQLVERIKVELMLARDIKLVSRKVDQALRGQVYMTGAKNDRIASAKKIAAYYRHRNQTSQFKVNADDLGKDYWGNPQELFARAGEAWVFDTLKAPSDYLVTNWVADGHVKPPTYRGTPYPSGDERARFAELYVALFASLDWTSEGPVVNVEKTRAEWPQHETHFDKAVNEIIANVEATYAQIEADAEFEKRKKEKEKEPAPPPPAPPAAPASNTAEAAIESNATPSVDDLAALFDEAASELREGIQEQPDAPNPGDPAVTGAKLSDTSEQEKVKNLLSGRDGRAETDAEKKARAARGEGDAQQRWDAMGYGERQDIAEASDIGGMRKVVHRIAGSKWSELSPGEQASMGKLMDKSQRRAAQIAAEAAKLGVQGIDETLKGLGKLFGGNKLNTFPPTIDPDKYAQAKPHFEAALKAFQAAGRTLKDFFKFLIENFGESIKAYAIHFAKEKGLSANLTESAQQSASMRTARKVADWLRTGTTFSGANLFKLADLYFGGTQAEGAYTVKDAYDAMEAGVQLYLREGGWGQSDDLAKTKRDVANLTRMLEGLATQTKRTQETDEFQQFSTPPHYAYVANWVANIQYGETMLEPSAGIGGLAIFGELAGARLVLNELSARRAGVLRDLFPNARVFTEDGEQLNNILPADVRPTVIVMNPPFSSTAGRIPGRREAANGARHLEQALARLAPGGRLVAIMGKTMVEDSATLKDFWKATARNYKIRANVLVEGDNYSKYGTGYDNRLIVIDKTGPTIENSVIRGKVETIEQLIDRLEGVRNDRTQIAVTPVESARPEQGGGATAGEGGARPDQAGPDAQPARPGDVGDRGAAGGRPGSRTGGDKDPATGRGRPGGRDALPGGAGGRDGANTNRPDDAGAKSGVGGGAGGKFNTDDNASAGAVDVQAKAAERAKDELSDAVFEVYKPQRLSIPGSKPHPAELVQSAAMAAVEPPNPTYTPNIPERVIKDGLLSIAQLEAVVYAGQAHSDFLPSGERRGFFIGDGTGVGKGREIGGIILDNWRQGRKKAVWVSEKSGLIEDARRDFSGVTGNPDLIVSQGDSKRSDKLPSGDGIMFTTYATLRSGDKLTDDDKKTGKTRFDKENRLKQLVEWLGKDFDGVIAFDEAHNMRGAAPTGGERGTKDATLNGIVGLELQSMLPKARVVYVSATGATEVSNLAYAARLGLWGEGTAFAGRDDFIASIDAAGVSAMEIVAQNMKQMGVYIARSLSFHGIQYTTLEAPLSDLNREIYDELARAWQVVLSNINEALAMTHQDGKGGSKGQRMSAFWGAQQRFFNQIITSMQMPAILDAIRADLDAGYSSVLQFVNTNEAAQERMLGRKLGALAEGESEDTILEDLDFTPREGLIEMVMKVFPTQQFEEYADENGKTRVRPVVDSQGNPVQNMEAVAMRDQMVENLRNIRVPDNPLDTAINAFGPKVVAEITGRKRRFVRVEGKDGEFKVEEQKRGSSANRKDADDFMDDRKRVLLFSDAGGTGYSFQADKGKKNQRLRRHYLVQPGWRADKAVQGFGRTHRTNQKQAPEYILPRTDLKAQKRFISSIARRLDQLGALTKGQRQASGGQMFNPADNLESKYAVMGLRAFIEDVISGGTPIDRDELLQKIGMTGLINEQGQMNEKAMPTVQQFLNRMLSLEVHWQDRVFEEFFQRVEAAVQRAVQAGTFDDGMQTIKGLGTEKLRDVVVHTDTRGANTRYVELEVEHPHTFVEFDVVRQIAAAPDQKFIGWFLDRRPGLNGVVAFFDRGTLTNDRGQIARQAMRVSPTKRDYIGNAGHLMGDAGSTVPTTSSEVTDLFLPLPENLDWQVARTLVADGPSGSSNYGVQGQLQTKGLKATLEWIQSEHAREPDTPPELRDARLAVVEKARPLLKQETKKTSIPRYEKVDEKQAQAAWAAQIKASPKTYKEKLDMITGAMLPIWNRLPQLVRVGRTQTSDGERLLGRLIAPKDLDETLTKLGVGSAAAELSPAQQLAEIMAGKKAILANGWILKTVRVSGNLRIEIESRYISTAAETLLKEQGAFVERIQFKERWFIPVGNEQVFERIVADKPVVKLVAAGEAGGAAPLTAEQQPAAYGATMAPSEQANFYGIQVSQAPGRVEAPAGGSSSGTRNVQPARTLSGSGAIIAATIVEPAQVGNIRSGFEVVDTAQKAAHVFAGLRKEPRERFDALLLDKNDKPLAVLRLFAGTIGQTSVYADPLVMAAFQTEGAASIWFAHNHPSGAAEPSRADITLTDHLADYFRGTGIKLNGHVIIADTRAVEFTVKRGDVAVQADVLRVFQIPPAARKYAIPIMERRVRVGGKLAGALSSPNHSKEFLKSEFADKQGLLFVDSQNRPVGFMKMTFKEMGMLRTGDSGSGAGRLFKTLGLVNATGAIFHAPKNDVHDRGLITALSNVAALLRSMDVRLLDGIANGESMAQRDTLPYGRGNTFLSRSGRRNPQTLTENFKRWFRDSMVTDDIGNPLVVYHGTSADEDFSEFYEMSHFGTRDQANERSSFYSPDGSRLMPVYLSITNPVRITDDGRQHDPRGLLEQLVNDAVLEPFQSYQVRDAAEENGGSDKAFMRAIADKLEDMGYDGVVYKNTTEGDLADSYIALRPWQVKSAIGNNGEFDPWNNDIRFSRNELSASPAGNRVIDGPALQALRREAASLENTAGGVYLRVSGDGVAVATGPAGKRVPDTFKAFASKHGLTLYVARFGNTELDGKPLHASFSKHDPSYMTSVPMPQSYRESGALYFPEMGAPYLLTPAEGRNMFSRSRRGGISRADANTVAQAFRINLEGMPPLHLVKSVDQAPAGLRLDIQSMNAEGDVAGAWHNGEIWLFLDHIANPEHMAWVVMHELTHAGLRGILGSDLDSALFEIYNGHKGIRAMVDARRRNKDQTLSIVETVEEVLADLGGDGVPPSVWTRLIAWVRRVLRKLGVNLDVSDAEVRDLVSRALGFVKNKPFDYARVAREGKTSAADRSMRALAMDVERLERLVDSAYKAGSPSSTALDAELAEKRARLIGMAEESIEDELNGDDEPGVDDEPNVDDEDNGDAELNGDNEPSEDNEPDSMESQLAHAYVNYKRGGGLFGSKKDAIANMRGAIETSGLVFKDTAPFTDARILDVARDVYEAEIQRRARRGNTALSRSGRPGSKNREGALNIALRLPMQALGIDKVTTKAHDYLLGLIGELTPEKIKAGVIADYGLDEEVRDRRDAAFVAVRKSEREIKTIIDSMVTLDRAQSRVAYEWMTTNDPKSSDRLLAQLPEDSRGLLGKVKAQIVDMGREAVRLGQLSQESFERNMMAYLHRTYAKYELADEQGQVARRRAIQVLGDQYKGRGIVDEVKMAAVRNIAPEWWGRMLKSGRADKGLKGQTFLRFERRENRGEGVAPLPGMEKTGQLGRILEVAYWPSGEPVPDRFGGWHQDAGVWTARDTRGEKLLMWRDFTKAERERMGELDEVKYAIAKTLHMMNRDIEIGRYLEWLAAHQARPRPEGPEVEASERMVEAYKPGTWVQVPEGKIPGTNTLRYGRLAGLYVPGPVWNDIRQVANPTYRPFGALYASTMKWFKVSKTALSPVVHVNNVMANFMFADLQDLTARDMYDALRGWVDYKRGSAEGKKLWNRFEDSGATSGMFTTHELFRETVEPLLEELRKEIQAGGDGAAMEAANVLALVAHGKVREAAAAAGQSKVASLARKAADKMIDAYQFEDEIFRFAVFLRETKAGKDDREAGKLAKGAFLDYNINAPWIQALRGTVLPFVSFTYRALPLLLKEFSRKPWKVAKYMMVAGGLNTVAYTMMGLDGDDEDRERRFLPDEKAGKIWGMVPKLMRMPWNDTHGQPVFLDIRRWVPLGDIFDQGATHSAFPLLPAVIPGGPLAVLGEIVWNQSLFTGREITKETDTPMEVAKKVGEHLYKAFTPNAPWIPLSYSFDALMNAGSGKTDVFGRDRSMAQATASVFGLKLASYAPDVLQRNILIEYRIQDAEIQRVIRGLAREHARKGITREEFDEKLKAQMDKRRKLMQEVREKLGR